MIGKLYEYFFPPNRLRITLTDGEIEKKKNRVALGMRVLNSQGDEQKYSVLFSFSQRSRKKIVHFCDIVPGVSFIPEDLDVLGVLLENQKPPKNIPPLVSKSEGCFL